MSVLRKIANGMCLESTTVYKGHWVLELKLAIFSIKKKILKI